MENVITMIGSEECGADGTPVSNRVLKRVAEASEGFPDGQGYWFVCPRDPRNGGKVLEYSTCKEAIDAIGDPDLYMIVGPVYRPRKGSANFGGPRVDTPLKTITLCFDDDTIKPVTLSAKKWDALFWGPASVDKFAVPYYVGASGIEYGALVHESFHGTSICSSPPEREEAANGGADVYAFVHEPDTDYSVFVLPGLGFLGEQPAELLL